LRGRKKNQKKRDVVTLKGGKVWKSINLDYGTVNSARGSRKAGGKKKVCRRGTKLVGGGKLTRHGNGGEGGVLGKKLI